MCECSSELSESEGRSLSLRAHRPVKGHAGQYKGAQATTVSFIENAIPRASLYIWLWTSNCAGTIFWSIHARIT